MTATDQGGSRAQRVLATMAFALIGLSALSIVALLILGASGVRITGALVVLQILPLPGLTIGLLLVIALFVVLAVRRSRGQRPQRSRR
ncbi:hypothetical protein [uncultured Amnibacterium sp.]|uniref:hypothetical protein n=1 Tax=uncultured Amnibacterium sp. TaxID=1631851 RepID=UPI0035CBA67C